MLSLVSHSAATFVRLVGGLLLGGVLGLALGLAVSWSRWSRRLVELPMQFLRALPLLAMVPLFQLWFGTYFIGQVLFVAYGVGVIVFAGVVNAVRNVPQIYLDNARSLGASRVAALSHRDPAGDLARHALGTLLSLGAGWGAVLAAEYLGAQSGLGYIIVYAQQFGLLDRMFLVALLFILYTSVSYWAIERALRAAARLVAGRGRAMNAASRSDAALDLVERLRRGETSAVEAMRFYPSYRGAGERRPRLRLSRA